MNARARTIAVRCPVCRQPVRRDSPHFPFCGERCKQIDLGRWASEDYRIAGEPATPWELESGEDE
jgi:endogenous inhibitor of DNA gyrase (YacG/DUF329 family)